jgi:hypothetical protein
MRTRLLAVAAVVAWGAATLGAQSPPTIDTSKIGPQVGSVVPAFAGVDQFGKPRTLASVAGPNGAMIVFFRSADW